MDKRPVEVPLSIGDSEVTTTLDNSNAKSSVSARQVPESRYDLRVLQALRQIIRSVDLHSRKLLGQYKITGPQLITLLAIEKHQPLAVSAIAAEIHLSSSTVIGILDRLDSKGLILRQRDMKDRRLVKVSLTEAGVEVARHAPSPLQETLAQAMSELPDSELEVIAESLERVVGLMQMKHVNAAPFLETSPIVPPSE